MISVFVAGSAGLVASEAAAAIPENAVWLDIEHPSREDEAVAETFLRVDVPTHEERVEIETSSRLYEEDGALVMSATIPCGTQGEQPDTTVVTFLLKGDRLATIRYGAPNSFAMARQRSLKAGDQVRDGKGTLLLILDAIVDRLADILEVAGAEADRLSGEIFTRETNAQNVRDYDITIRALGRLGTLMSKIHESLVSLSRLIQFLAAREKRLEMTGNEKAQIKSLTRDVRSISEYASSIDQKVTFLLDATLGLVGIQQNQTIKIISVLSVILMPPTLVASVYGMNFAFMPETQWKFGYPLVLLIMAMSAAGTWVLFRWKRWL